MDDHPATSEKLVGILNSMTHIEGSGIYCGSEQLAQISGLFCEDTSYAVIKDLEGKCEYGIVSNGGIYHNKDLIATINDGVVRLETNFRSRSLCLIDEQGIVNHGIVRNRTNRSKNYKDMIAELKEQQREDLKEVDRIYDNTQSKKPGFYQRLVFKALKIIGKKEDKQVDKNIALEFDI